MITFFSVFCLNKEVELKKKKSKETCCYSPQLQISDDTVHTFYQVLLMLYALVVQGESQLELLS